MKRGDTYSWPDRMLHRVAFSALAAQVAVSDIEDRVFSKRLEPIELRHPVFITALPRAGTTLLLEILSRLGDFAAHSYRNMPFVMCPLLWNGISRPLRARAAPRERSHGDGIMIDIDSPEALEEVIWKTFWRAKYRSDRIETWSVQDRDEEFEEFFSNHMRKMIALETTGDPVTTRYLSKNNANIARLDILRELFSDCTILVPIREPWSHIGSLRAQHRRFSEIHAHDAFALRYMTWLGHHEFGSALKPIDFGAWVDKTSHGAPPTADFWVRYWLAYAHAMIEARRENIYFFDYDRACTEPRGMLAALSDALEIRDTGALLEGASRFHPPTRYDFTHEVIDPDLRAEVDKVYSDLRSLAP
jgi:hypothetical protein